ncbi:MAG: hypothetical protein HKP52_09120 [Desulfofustis sp.]|nr:hypothetical protein [Desulfofustis sp.]
MKKIRPFAIIVIFLLPAIAFMTFYNLRMDKERHEPHIYTLTGGRVLVAQIKGDPDVTMDTAVTTLYSASRKLKLSPSYMSARHLKWNQRYTTPVQDWVVYFSKMVPETAKSLAGIKDTADVKIFYERRQKTEIAEILHIGRYEQIPDSLEKLRQFIDEEGYKLSGFYEEVYMVFEQIESNPYEYETLLRYEVIK